MNYITATDVNSLVISVTLCHDMLIIYSLHLSSSRTQLLKHTPGIYRTIGWTLRICTHKIQRISLFFCEFYNDVSQGSDILFVPFLCLYPVSIIRKYINFVLREYGLYVSIVAFIGLPMIDSILWAVNTHTQPEHS